MAIRSEARWDLSVDSRKGQRMLVVEVKCKTNVSAEWATRFRQNLLAHGTLPKAPYFLMAFLDRFYLWTDAESASDERPTYTIDARPILEPYFVRAGVTADHISRHSFELIVAAWLEAMIQAEKSPEDAPSQRWLLDSGLYAALAGGRLDYEAAT